MNALYYGDCLDVLRESIKDESVDLVYLDPPFNSKRDYSVLFKTHKGTESEAQITAFEDTWHWTEKAEREFHQVVKQNNTAVTEMMIAFRGFLGTNDMMAYLTMMANRLLELRRVLKPTGSLYLHCDPTASHYLKILLDAVFGPQNFRNEIIWKRTSAHSGAVKYGAVHDTILFYTRSSNYTWNPQYQPFDQYYIDQFYTHVDRDGRRWMRADLTGAGTRKGETGKVWRGIDVNAKGRHWAYMPDALDRLDAAGKIHWPSKTGGMPRLKKYLDEQPGITLQDVWSDFSAMHNLSAERLGYPTQKPQALLERIILTSSNPNDLVLDPFCGCGTATHAAQATGRHWIGIDITHLAISLIESRMRDAFHDSLQYEVIGVPKDYEAARDLAARNKYQFQYWACSLVKAKPLTKKGADHGIDGILYFQDDEFDVKKCITSVKGGDNINVGMVRDLKGVLEREKSPIGLFVTLNAPTKPMIAEAAAAGMYESKHLGVFPRIQILTIEGLLEGREQPKIPDMTLGDLTFKKAKRELPRTTQEELGL